MKTANDVHDNTNCVLITKKEDAVSDLPSPGTSISESSESVCESKRMKGMRANVKEKSVSSKHVRMKKRKEVSRSSKCACNDAFERRNPN